jgi:hypothetical protein
MERKLCFLAFIDLLGFSRTVADEPIEHVAFIIRKFQSITRSIVSRANRYRRTHGRNPGLKSRIRIFSDLVLVYTEGDTQDDCMDIVEVTSKILWLSFFHGLLPRGAIAWGEMVVGPFVTVGRPLVEAYALEARQDWAGASVCDSVIVWDAHHGRTADNKSSILECMTGAWLIPWAVPTKDGTSEQRLAVNWLGFDQRRLLHRRFCDPVGLPEPIDARRKLSNTESFYRHVVALKNHDA